MPSRWPKRRHVFYFLLANVAAIVVGYALFFTSEPYEFATNFIAGDPRVLEVTGVQQSRRVNLLNARATIGDRTGEARFFFDVKNERGEFAVSIEMDKSAGLWFATRVHATSNTGAKTVIVGTR